MILIRNFDEYRDFASGRFRWGPEEVRFDFPIEESVCGSCGARFQPSAYLFIVCYGCLSRMVVVQKGREYNSVVYGLYSDSNHLLYIGVTKNPLSRAHNHMLDKNFKTMKIIRYFASRSEADDFEKYSICRLKPPMNRLFEKDWNSVPKQWFSSEFGTVATRPKKTRKHNRVKEPLALCHKCHDRVGRNNRVDEGDKTFHKKCSPSRIFTLDVLAESDKAAHAASQEEWASRKKEIAEHNARIKKLNREPRTESSGKGGSVPKTLCRYCKKPVAAGRHVACRRKMLKELGNLRSNDG